MPDTASQFIRCNLMSRVKKIKVTARGTRYRLVDGNSFLLSKSEMDKLSDFIGRNGYTIRITDELAERIDGPAAAKRRRNRLSGGA